MAKKTEKAVVRLPTDKLYVAEFHRRTRWGNLKDLAASIGSNDVIVPLSVRPPKGGKYEINAGVRRWRAATIAGLADVPCIIEEMDDVDAIVRQVEENTGVPLHPMDVAEYYDELNRMGLEIADIAVKFHVKKRDIQRRLMLLGLGKPARKAFAADRFDEKAAFALARVSDDDKQKDIIAALDAGSLQPEEIEGYVSRMFTASLDDVPWRMSDEKLLPIAGACTTCPKRSDAQKDLFGDATKGLRCLDVDCYREKMDASWKAETAKPGLSVLEQQPESLFVLSGGSARPVVMRSTGMVDLDVECPHLKGRTWRQAIDKAIKPDAERPSEYVARDQDGRPRYLVRESTASKIVKKSDAAKEAAEQAASTDPGRPDNTNARAEAKVRRSVIAKLAEVATAGEADTWGWVAERVVESATARAIAATADLLGESLRGANMTVNKDGLVALAQTSNRQARRVVTAILVFDESDVVGEIGPPLHALAALCGLDLEVVDGDIRKA